MSNWFNNVFLKSFDICNGKRISEKQFNIFNDNLKGYLYKTSDRDNTCIDEYHYNDLVIILQQSKAGFGTGWIEYYLTIRSK